MQELETIRRLRTEERRRPVRGAILLDARAGMSNPTIVRAHHVSRNTVVRCINKCLRFGVEAALKSGKAPPIDSDAPMINSMRLSAMHCDILVSIWCLFL